MHQFNYLMASLPFEVESPESPLERIVDFNFGVTATLIVPNLVLFPETFLSLISDEPTESF